MKISVIGAGPWGTTVTNLIKRNNEKNSVYLWAYQKILDKNIILDEDIAVSENINSVISHGDVVFVVVNSNFLVQTMKDIKEDISEKKFVFLTKGFVHYNDEIMLPKDYIMKEFNVKQENIAVISGPNIANEINEKKRTYTTIASYDKEFANKTKQILENIYFIPFISDDVFGVEVAGIVKNPYAIAFGIVDEMNIGNNFKSAFMSHCLNEIELIIKKFNGKEETAKGISGYGDFFTTCFSGRNKLVGEMIAKGKSMKDIYEHFSPQKPEGVEQVKILDKLIKNKTNLPIFRTLYSILFHNKKIESLFDVI